MRLRYPNFGITLRRAAVAAFFFVCALLPAQYTGPYVTLVGVMSSSNGMPARNYILTFDPTQVMFVGGTSTVVSNSTCATDANGQVVGMPNPLQGPVLTPVYSGTLPAGNFYVKITWYDTYGNETLPSPEIQAQLTNTGELQVSPPITGAPANAIGMDVYIGSTAGSETYQGQTTSPTSTFTQSVPLTTSGRVPPIQNGTKCQVVANDAAWPIAGYTATLTTPAGNTVPGFPQQWQFTGPGSTYNLSNGFPLYNGRVTYPVPILTTPYNHNPQSISGPLSMTGYNVYNVGALGVGTALPAYGVDVEGTGAGGAVSAGQGFLVNGAAGTTGQALCSDGTYLDQFCTFLTSLPTLYYQTVALNGTAMTQRGELNFNSYFLLTDNGPTSTNVAPKIAGTDAYLATAAGPSTLNYFACGDSLGGTQWSSTACTGSATAANDFFKFTGCSVNNSGNLNSCSGTVTFTSGGNTTPSFPAMADTNYRILCNVDTGTTSSASFSVTGSTASGNTPAFTRTTSGFTYVWTEVMANGASGSAGPQIDCYLHHD